MWLKPQECDNMNREKYMEKTENRNIAGLSESSDSDSQNAQPVYGYVIEIKYNEEKSGVGVPVYEAKIEIVSDGKMSSIKFREFIEKHLRLGKVKIIYEGE